LLATLVIKPAKLTRTFVYLGGILQSLSNAFGSGFGCPVAQSNGAGVEQQR